MCIIRDGALLGVCRDRDLTRYIKIKWTCTIRVAWTILEWLLNR